MKAENSISASEINARSRLRSVFSRVCVPMKAASKRMLPNSNDRHPISEGSRPTVEDNEEKVDLLARAWYTEERLSFIDKSAFDKLGRRRVQMRSSRWYRRDAVPVMLRCILRLLRYC